MSLWKTKQGNSSIIQSNIISTSVVHNLIKRFIESEEISGRNGKGWKPLLNGWIFWLSVLMQVIKAHVWLRGRNDYMGKREVLKTIISEHSTPLQVRFYYPDKKKHK